VLLLLATLSLITRISDSRERKKLRKQR